MLQVVNLRDMKLESDDRAGQEKKVWLETGSRYKGNIEHLSRCLTFGVEARGGHLPLHLADLTPVTSAPRSLFPTNRGFE